MKGRNDTGHKAPLSFGIWRVACIPMVIGMKRFVPLTLCMLLLLCMAGCQSRQDKAYDALMAPSSEAAEPRESAAGSSGAGPEEKPQPDTGLAADLVLCTYTSDASVEIWKDYIREFNETYPDVHIEVKDSEAVSDVPGYITRTTVELMSGEAGDILDLEWLPAQRYSMSGVLAELDSLMEASPDFAGDRYYTNVFDGMRCGGKLYAMPYEFTPVGIRLHKKAADALHIEYGTGKPLRVSEVLQLAAQANALPEYKDMPVLGYCLWDGFNFAELSSRINENEKTADLDSGSFIQYLTALKALGYSENATIGAALMPDDGNLSGGFCSMVNLWTTHEIFAGNYVDMLDSPSVTPMMALETDEGGRLYSAKSLAITSSCKNKEAAFAFLKFVLDSERKLDPENFMRTAFVPVNRGINKRAMEIYYGKDYGDETQAIDQWCAEVDTVVFYDRSRELLGKLNEICDQYMRDLISAEECARQMQGLADIYLHE